MSVKELIKTGDSIHNEKRMPSTEASYKQKAKEFGISLCPYKVDAILCYPTIVYCDIRVCFNIRYAGIYQVKSDRRHLELRWPPNDIPRTRFTQVRVWPAKFTKCVLHQNEAYLIFTDVKGSETATKWTSNDCDILLNTKMHGEKPTFVLEKKEYFF